MNIFVVTPFSGATAHLVPAFAAAVSGCTLILIDNASDAETAAALDRLADDGAILIRNDFNRGFAEANNQGYAAAYALAAPDDVILFLNSDVEADDPRWLDSIAAIVTQDDRLYGPSLQHQLIAGRWLPYIEGWCIAARAASWHKLRPASDEGRLVQDEHPVQEGPWNAEAFPGPYWEDNDLCFYAICTGFTLVQTQWPIRHLGGKTAGALRKHGLSFEQNRLRFSYHVTNRFRHTPDDDDTPLMARYRELCATPSDIQHHLPLLFGLAMQQGVVVVELGTRSGVSTAALLAGVERRAGLRKGFSWQGHVWSVDTDDCSHLYNDVPFWTFVRGDSRIGPWLVDEQGDDIFATVREKRINVLLIDTLHTYTHVIEELQAWGDWMAPGGVICIHDPMTFPGVARAAREYCADRGWTLTFVTPCNGMAVIEVPR